MIDFNFKNSNPPTKGSLLISEPFLSDQYFSRSVIFLCDHNENGSFGFVLNNYLEAQLRDILSNYSELKTRVSIGGPVDTTSLFFIHGLGDEIPGSMKIIDGLYIGGNFENVCNVVAKNPKKIDSVRFFIGYSGWAEDQLNQEIAENSWLVLNNIDSSLILQTDQEDIWKDLMENLGGKFKIMSTFPINPSDN